MSYGILWDFIAFCGISNGILIGFYEYYLIFVGILCFSFDFIALCGNSIGILIGFHEYYLIFWGFYFLF